MRKTHKFIALLTLLFVVAVTSLTYQALHAPLAHAAGLCSGSGCNNQDPYQMKCAADGYQVEYRTSSGGYEKMWYSPSCNANWMSGTSYSGYYIAQFTMYSCTNNLFDGQGNCTASNPTTYCEGTGPGYGYCTPIIYYWYTYILNDIPYNAQQGTGVTHWYTNMIVGTWKVQGTASFFTAGNINNGVTIVGSWH